jgi:hypothetical protein
MIWRRWRSIIGANALGPAERHNCTGSGYYRDTAHLPRSDFMTRTHSLLATALLLTAAAPLLAQSPLERRDGASVTWRNLTFTVPAGWVAAQSNAQAFALKRVVGGRTAALIIGSGELRPPDARAAAIALAQSAAGQGALESENLRTAQLPDGTPVTYGFGAGEVSGTRVSVYPVVVQAAPQAFGVMLVEFSSGDAETSQRGLGALLTSMRGHANAAQSNGASQRVTGFFARIGATVVVNPLSGAAPGIGVIEMQLLADGQFVLAAPHDAGDVDRYCATHRTDCGRYLIRDGVFSRMRPRTAFEERFGLVGEDERDSLRPSRVGGLQIGDARWSRIAPLSGTPLNGDFVGTSGGSIANDGSGGSSSVLTETTYRFRPDGRVWEGGYTAFTSSSGEAFPDVRVGTTSAGPVRVKAGRYRFNGYTVEFTWDTGARESKSGYVLDGVVIIDGRSYAPRQSSAVRR